MIRDIPSYFGSFSPSNADKSYSGVVTARSALIRSLNIPAVRLLNACGLRNFYVFLKAAGMTTLFREAEDYGLTLILGGAEATLFDMARLYRGLANYGKFGPLQLGDIGPIGPIGPIKEVELLSPGACYLTLQMMRDVKRPGSEYYWDQYQDRYPLAWKTGTSYGQRDAWAVGVTPQWTIAVWVGNFSGEGNSNLSGARGAAPLLFDIFNYLPKPKENLWFKRPDRDLVPVKVCMDTGFAAGHDCEKTVTVLSPGSRNPLKPCPFHKRIFVSSDSGRQVCSLCWRPGQYKSVKKLLYPPDIAQYLRESGVAATGLPPHSPGCKGGHGVGGNPVRIIYPVAKAKL
jgi:penicillin-binding protein 1C